MTSETLPVAVIGAGPVGLAAAAHLLQQGQEPVVFDAASTVGAGMLSWGHVRVFSPWRYVVDEAAKALLEPTGWVSPDSEGFPTGREIVEQYLRPLAESPELQGRIRFGSRVNGVARAGFDKMKTPGREEAPFLLTIDSAAGETTFLAKAVIDASGTIEGANPLGSSGLPAIGERALRDRIFYGIPDVLGLHRDRYAGKRVLVVGSGHSAFNALLDLVDLAAEVPETSVVWAVRRPGSGLGNLFGGGIGDALPARGELGQRVQELVSAGRLQLVTGFRVKRLTDTAEGIVVADDDAVLPAVDEIVACTGFRPDLSALSELRLSLDPAVESPAVLAPMIDPNVHSCGSVPPHGARELKHPETDFYIAGMKSYGRAPTFLMLTGYEQVRSISAAIAGDWEAANDVRLVLPETGVCSSGILADRGVLCCDSSAASAGDECCGGGESKTAGGCCGDQAPKVIQLSAIGRGGGGGGCCSS